MSFSARCVAACRKALRGEAVHNRFPEPLELVQLLRVGGEIDLLRERIACPDLALGVALMDRLPAIRMHPTEECFDFPALVPLVLDAAKMIGSYASLGRPPKRVPTPR